MKGFFGIDVSKGFSDFILLNEKREVLEPAFNLDDTRKGHDLLQKKLVDLIGRHQITDLYCGVESTGGLENNWYQAL